mgnify:CR=1 FL=1|jgi:uncharacterized membrane protein HdeD (DUF308 family)
MIRRRTTFNLSELILGIIFVALGIFTFINPNTALGGFVIVYGIVAILGGIANIIFYVQLEKRTGFGPVSSLVGGIFSILLGVLLLFNVNIGKVTFIIIFPIWFIIHCISRLFNLSYVKYFGGKALFYFSLIINIIGLLLGFVLLFNPFASALTLVYLIGIFLIVSGIGSIVISIIGFSRKQ